MEMYKNDYTKEEDELLWEIHEIRHQIHKERKNKSYEEINDEVKKMMNERKALRAKKHHIKDA